MRVFIYSFEGKYQGLHGIEALTVTEVENIEIANEIGKENAIDLIYQYGLEEEYFEDAEWYGEDEIDTSECGWHIYEIKDEINLTIEELDNLCCQLGYGLFIKEYCKLDILY